MRAIINQEQQEAESVKNAVVDLCKHYGFVKADVAFGDMDGQLFFLLKGTTADNQQPKPVLGIIKDMTP